MKPTVTYRIFCRKPVGVALFFAMAIAGLTKCVGAGDKSAPGGELDGGEMGTVYVGDDACRSCHAQQVEEHFQTAHHHSSAWGNEDAIKGSLLPGQNQFRFSARLDIRVEKIGDSVYQTAYILGDARERRSVDLVFGSGTKGQSFASWKGDRLFQLPITWFTPEHQWSNSPGFPGKAVFNRPITARCLECHITYAKIVSEPGIEPESFDQKSLVLTISCEKCHGPGNRHVEWQQKNLSDTNGRYIANPALFTRQQQLDLCGLCHAGKLNASSNAFGFQTGNLLKDYFRMDSLVTNPLAMDVHGNQMGLLAASRCFTQSSMTCNTCHDPHKLERGQLSVISQRCLSCHKDTQQTVCSFKGLASDVLAQNCIDCHMEKELSRSVAVQLQGHDVPTPALMRSHHIQVPTHLPEWVIKKK